MLYIGACYDNVQTPSGMSTEQQHCQHKSVLCTRRCNTRSTGKLTTS